MDGQRTSFTIRDIIWPVFKIQDVMNLLSKTASCQSQMLFVNATQQCKPAGYALAREIFTHTAERHTTQEIRIVRK